MICPAQLDRVGVVCGAYIPDSPIWPGSPSWPHKHLLADNRASTGPTPPTISSAWITFIASLLFQRMCKYVKLSKELDDAPQHAFVKRHLMFAHQRKREKNHIDGYASWSELPLFPECLLFRLGAVQRKKNSKNPRILWKWVGGSGSHSDFFWKIITK